MPDRFRIPTEQPIYRPGCRQLKWAAYLCGYWSDFEPMEVCNECWDRGLVDPPKTFPPLPKIEREERRISDSERYPISCARCKRTLNRVKWLAIVEDRITHVQVRLCHDCYRATTGEEPPAGE